MKISHNKKRHRYFLPQGKKFQRSSTLFKAEDALILPYGKKA